MSSTPMPRARKGRTCQRAVSARGRCQHGDVATTWEEGTQGSSPGTYLRGGCVEGDAEQRAKPQARGHGEGHQQDPGQAHGALGLGAVPPQHGDAGVGQLEEHSGLAGTERGRRDRAGRGWREGDVRTMRR